ncbi:hypothetical protein GCM10010495_19620 [Kitasatospora herbaricolor]|nr:hypothetical protein GCM10010495_19620 [Kitasatospora herbaricolor]
MVREAPGPQPPDPYRTPFRTIADHFPPHKTPAQNPFQPFRLFRTTPNHRTERHTMPTTTPATPRLSRKLDTPEPRARSPPSSGGAPVAGPGVAIDSRAPRYR